MYRFTCFILYYSVDLLLSFLLLLLLFFFFFFFFGFSVCCSDRLISVILLFRSLICSSVLFNWLLIASRLVFISAVEFCIFD